MATYNLPYPPADNHSYLPAHSPSIRSEAAGFLVQDDLQRRPSSPYKPDHRIYHYPIVTEATSGDGLSDYNPRLQVAESLEHPGPSGSRSRYASNGGNQHFVAASEQAQSNSALYRVDYPLSNHYTDPALSETSHSPPGISEPLLNTSNNSEPPESGPYPSSVLSTSLKRKEKTRISLSPDQPLTSQGKPRTRVYVACVQCRSRKIRCDGAKPICHNCSRRTGSPSTLPPDCTYDTVPKRRGPDRNPGARQRHPGQETSEGGKVRKRRRRAAHTQPDDGPVKTVNTLTNGDVADGLDQQPLRMDPIAHISEAAESHAPTKLAGLTPLIDDIGVYSDQSRTTVYSHGSSTGSSRTAPHLPFPTSLPQDVDAVTQVQPTASLTSPQFNQSPIYYESSEPALTYVGYVPPAVVAGHSDEYEGAQGFRSEIGAEPSLQFTRATWWDALLLLYSGRTYGRPPDGTALTPSQRESTVQQILSDTRQLFRASNYWFSFFNVSQFYARLLDPKERQRIQPSLVLGALAVSVFIHSSEREGGKKGRTWAVRLRDEAQSALEASLSTRAVDVGLVQAAWLIAFFEICAHPYHSSYRVQASFSLLDSLIRSLSLTQVDKDDARVSEFSSQLVPKVSLLSSHPRGHQHGWDSSTPQGHPAVVPSQDGCTCASYTLGHNNPTAQRVTPLWLTTPAWGANWSEAEINKEECRRVVWSSMMLSAGHSSYTTASGGFSQLNLFVSDPANYAILFPGESVMSEGQQGAKDSIWALYMRIMLLWHSCVRMRRQTQMSDGEKAHFAVNAWLEVDRLDEALNRHTCNLERSYLYQGREYLLNCRMCISHEFSRYIPQATASANLLFHRKKAEEWLTHQAWVGKTLLNGLQTVTGQPNVSMGKRPFFVFWFMSQIRRALTLWSCDQTLIIALDVAKTLMSPIEFLMALWPCREQRQRYSDMIDILANACATAGLPPPQRFRSVDDVPI
ncbi:hypothetical protein BXZ70DRAFT_921504 [Cristinia sonorae]|uniref:Zn(2)-C6 fungal-type domain-containing protein n=1 Tax=Cristinia sonorae TaxID=1940300 RepID=A0A8K0UWH1_9AGAR|nr:hypothetical protein BXZ70DRAFT_921504 [Cristinia sonorae]